MYNSLIIVEIISSIDKIISSLKPMRLASE